MKWENQKKKENKFGKTKPRREREREREGDLMKLTNESEDKPK